MSLGVSDSRRLYPATGASANAAAWQAGDASTDRVGSHRPAERKGAGKKGLTRACEGCNIPLASRRTWLSR